MPLNFSDRRRMLLGGALVAIGLVILITGAHWLSPNSHDFLRGFVLGLSGVLAVAGLAAWRWRLFVRRIQESAARNNERKSRR